MSIVNMDTSTDTTTTTITEQKMDNDNDDMDALINQAAKMSLSEGKLMSDESLDKSVPAHYKQMKEEELINTIGFIVCNGVNDDQVKEGYLSILRRVYQEQKTTQYIDRVKAYISIRDAANKIKWQSQRAQYEQAYHKYSHNNADYDPTEFENPSAFSISPPLLNNHSLDSLADLMQQMSLRQ